VNRAIWLFWKNLTSPITIDQKKKVENELELAYEKMRKSMKNIDEARKKKEDEKMQLKLHIANIIDDYDKKKIEDEENIIP
jgi:hypothetical protein